MKIASIDIGSNSILMQILENNKIIIDKQGIARLSKGLNITNIIADATIIRAEEIMRQYSDICDIFDVDVVIAVGTSALREAKNSDEVIKRLEQCFNKKCKIEIISGEKEAEYSFIGAISGMNNIDTFVVLDVGGGSTELISGNKNKINYIISIPVGVVKLTEQFAIKQPLIYTNEIRDFIREQFAIIDVNKCIGDVIAVSGTPTAIAGITLGINEYNSDKINNFVFTKDILHRTSALIYSCSIEELVNKYYIEKERADVLSAGAIIIEEVINILNRNKFMVNVNGLRYGAAISYQLKI